MRLIIAGLIVIVAIIVVLAIMLGGFLRPGSAQRSSVSLQASPHATLTANPSSTPVILHVGDPAPNFTLATLADDRMISLSDYRGKPVILNFWSINCSNCLKDIPLLEKLYTTQQGAGKTFIIFGINTDSSDSFVDVARFQEQQHITYPFIVDDHYQARTLYGVTNTPSYYFIDRQGIIRAIVNGPLDTTLLHKDSEQIGITTS